MAQFLYIDNHDGFGERDFTKYLVDRNRFFRHTKNEPQLFDFAVTNINDGGDWVVPRRGARVLFFDDRWERRHASLTDGVLYTGFITEEPEPRFLGTNNGKVWAYSVQTSSEEFLANSKRLPVVTYVNKTRGFILADLLRRLFAESTILPYDLTGISDGGLEQLFQVDTGQSWSELAAAFAGADGYTYWVLDKFVYYGPEAKVTASADPLYNLVIDEDDPRYVPDNLDIKRVARDIINDITVFGLDEPTDIVREHFMSDGYQGFHNLAFDPYGVTENIVVEDDWTSEIDDSTWEEVETGGDFIQTFEGALNIIGGTGSMSATYLRGRRPIELKGILEFRDGEIYFPPTPTGVGYIGGLYEDETVTTGSLWCGWKLDANARTITPWGPSGLMSTKAYPIVFTRHYVLRRRIQVDRPVAFSQGYTQPSTQNLYRVDIVRRPNVSISWTIDEINNDDVNNVFTTSTTVAYTVGVLDPPDYVLYAPVASVDGHWVMNYTSVRKPQQAVLQVNGRQVKLGNYLDGGRATLLSENGNGKLSWYAVGEGGSSSIISYLNTVLGDAPGAYWRMDAVSAGVFADVSGYQRHATDNNVTEGEAGALNSDDNFSSLFNGSTSYCSGAAFETGATCSFEGWFKTTDAALNIIWSNRTVAGNGDFLGVFTGQIYYGSNDLGALTSNRTGLNDGRWHHVVWVSGGDQRVYIDGVLDKTTAGTKTAKNNPFRIGMDIFADNAIPGDGFFTGHIDEVAIYGLALTADQVKDHYKRATASFSDVVTVPQAGASIALTYYRKQASRARLRSDESILTERERYGDDGVRQKIVRADEITPAPRTSEECLSLAQAILSDAAFLRYEGTYNFEAVENTPTELRFWPKPGDRIMCKLDLPDGDELNQELTIQSVSSTMLGKGAYAIELGFGSINRFDLVIKDLILKRKTSFDDPVIRTDEADELSAVNQSFPYPADLLDATVTNITATTFDIALAGGGVPADVVNYEVRTDDTGWGNTNTDSGYVERFRATTKSFTRTQRDLRYFIRPYNASNQYAKRSAFIRVAAPGGNSFQMTGVSGDISPTRVSIRIPIPRDPDYAGIRVQQYNIGGTIYYQGNGDYHAILGTGISTILEAGYITVQIPNRGYFDAAGGQPGFTAFVSTYNLLGIFGFGQTVTIEAPAPGAFGSPTFSAGAFTANGSMTWTVAAGDVSNYTYTVESNKMTVLFDLRTTTVGGTLNNQLRIAIPASKLPVRDAATVVSITDNGTRTSGVASVTTGVGYITIERVDAANFAASTNLTSVQGQIVFEI